MNTCTMLTLRQMGLMTSQTVERVTFYADAKKELEELIKRSDNSECNKENTMKKKSIKSTVKIPKGCECDNTHEQNQTVCRACWKVGLRFELSPY